MKSNLKKIASYALADTVFEIVSRSFPDTTTNEHPVFRIKNLSQAEIARFLKVWKDNAHSIKKLAGAQIVISHKSAAHYPAEFIADPNNSITYYRNNNQGGLIYIETSRVSDEQGLRNIFTLRDGNFLDGSFDDKNSGFLVAEAIATAAWSNAVEQDTAIPKVILKSLLLILESLKKNGTPIPVRRFARFCALVALERALCGNSTYDLDETNSIIGQSLTELDLFPDNIWASQSSETRISRRLVLNYLHAELVAPNGSDLDGEALAQAAEVFTFKDREGIPLSTKEQEKWRKLSSTYCSAPTPLIRSELPYHIFEQLFAKDTQGMKLGERVESEIIDSKASRLSEFKKLGVTKGLDKRDQSDAVTFLEAESEDGQELPLRDLLKKQTLKMVEKVASPAIQSISNPLLKLAEISRQFAQNFEVENHNLTIKLVIGKHSKEATSTIGLLAFLYGPTLSSISENSKISSDGFRFEVDEKLLCQSSPPSVKDEDTNSKTEDKDYDLEEEVWAPLPLEFQLLDRDEKDENKTSILETEAGYQWYSPSIEMLALFWLLVAAPDAPKKNRLLHLPNEQSLGEWVKHCIRRTSSLCSLEQQSYLPESTEQELIRQLDHMYSGLRKSGAAEGLSKELLLNIFDEWLIIATRIKAEMVQAGSFDDRIDLFLNSDMIATSGGEGRLMLQTHPLRLRWIAHYLDKSEKLAEHALSGVLNLNDENSELYLDWINNLSPHQQPALVAGHNQATIFASSENGWTESFTPLNKHTSSSVDFTLDKSCTLEIAQQILAYLLAHPNKKDGLSLLIVMPSGSLLPSELLKLIRKGDWADLPVSVHVLAPGKNWPKIIEEFEKLPVEDRISNRSSLLPPLQLDLHNLDDEEPLKGILNGISCDIGIIPQFLSNDIQIQDQTTQDQHTAGSFDVLSDSPTALEGGANGDAITVSKLPSTSDPALEVWSTLVVRHRRTRPISEDRPENTDHVKLMINFKREAELFDLMHKLNHWVITIEQYISREQIENLEERPEILTVKDNVGSSGLYTLVVSSNSGRSHIVQRLERKLNRTLGDDVRTANNLSNRIYDEARSLAPSLALQAMGISRITEEMLGLVIAKHISEARMPIPKGGDFARIWISLDEYADWLSGQNSTRADLCRLTLQFIAGDLHVDILVVEAKLRQTYDPHGELQASKTLNLFRNIFSMENGDDLGQDKIDAQLWRSKILAAANTAGPDAKYFSGRIAKEVIGSSKVLPHEIRQKFIDGEFVVDSLRGLYSICNYTRTGDTKFSTAPSDASVEIAESFKDILINLATAKAPKHNLNGNILNIEEIENIGAGQISQDGKTENSTTSEQPLAVNDDGTQPNLKSSESDRSPKSEVTLKTKKGLSENELNQRYQTILDTFSEFGVNIRQPSELQDRFTEGPASIMYRIAPGTGVTPNMIYQKAESLKLALRLIEEQNVRFSINGGYINIDVPKNEADRYYVTAQELWENWSPKKGTLSCPIGIDQAGDSVEINFTSSNSPHLLIGGTTGSGKSEALNTILYGLTQHYSKNELKLLLVDPKGTELEPFEDLEHLQCQIGIDDEDACGLLDLAVQEMQSRYALLKSKKTRSISEFNQQASLDEKIPWWLIVLDEYADLTSDPDSKKAIESSLKRLAQKARAAGIHVIIATQKPSAEVISTNLRSNLPAQLALRVKSGTESRVIMDEQGAETLNGKGDAFLKSEGKLVRVQCGMYDDH